MSRILGGNLYDHVCRPFYTQDKMLARFQSDGIFPQLSDFLIIIKRIGEINSLHSLSILLGILSGPAALCGFRFCNSLFMPVYVMLMFCISRCGLCPLSGI